MIIIDRDLKLKSNLKLFRLTKKRNTIIITASKNKTKLKNMKKKNCKIIQINKLINRSDFLNLWRIFFNLGKRRILVESGLIFLNNLLRFKLINELFVFKSNKCLKNKGSNNIGSKYLRKYKLIKEEKVYLEEDKLFKVKA